MKFRVGAYLVSQYLYLALICLIFLIPFNISTSHTTSSFTSRSPKDKYNETLYPDYFAHISDVHVNHKYPERTEVFLTVLSQVEALNPMLSFITGDLADDFTHEKHPMAYGTQQKADHDLYNDLTKKYPKDKFIDLAGNHDEYGILSYDSTEHNYRKYHDVSLEEFQLNVINYKLRSGKNVKYVLYNPYNYPTGHAPFLFWPYPSNSLLNRMESTLSSISDEEEVIAMNHYPINLLLDLHKSNDGNTMKKILKNGKVSYHLSGHNHPKKALMQHHKETLLEVVGADVKTHKKYGIFTFDNERFVYHHIDSTKPNYLLITNPVPKDQLTSKQIFNERDAPIRALVFVNKEDSPDLTITGDVEGTMKCTDITNLKGNLVNESESNLSMWSCSYPASLSDGYHHIEIHGSYSKSLDFYIGDQMKGYREKVYSHSLVWQFPMSFIVGVIFLFIIVSPYHLKEEFSHYYMDWLEGDDGNYWKFTIFAGFLTIKMRLSRLPKWIQYLLFVLALYTLFGPLALVKVEKKVGIIFWYGMAIDSSASYALWGQMYATFYILFVMIPMIVLASSMTLQFHWCLIIDYIFVFATFCGNLYIIYRYLSESVSLPYCSFAPGLFLIPIFVYIMLIIWRVKCMNDESNEGNITEFYRRSLL